MKYEVKINEFGDKFHYVNDVLHKEDGPAIEFSYGRVDWYKNGKLHREDGPAIEFLFGHKEQWLNDKCYGNDDNFTNESWKKFVKTLIFS